MRDSKSERTSILADTIVRAKGFDDVTTILLLFSNLPNLSSCKSNLIHIGRKDMLDAAMRATWSQTHKQRSHHNNIYYHPFDCCRHVITAGLCVSNNRIDCIFVACNFGNYRAVYRMLTRRLQGQPQYGLVGMASGGMCPRLLRL